VATQSEGDVHDVSCMVSHTPCSGLFRVLGPSWGRAYSTSECECVCMCASDEGGARGALGAQPRGRQAERDEQFEQGRWVGAGHLLLML
jgi:hypothetical protein